MVTREVLRGVLVAPGGLGWWHRLRLSAGHRSGVAVLLGRGCADHLDNCGVFFLGGAGIGELFVHTYRMGKVAVTSHCSELGGDGAESGDSFFGSCLNGQPCCGNGCSLVDERLPIFQCAGAHIHLYGKYLGEEVWRRLVDQVVEADTALFEPGNHVPKEDKKADLVARSRATFQGDLLG